MLVLPFQVNEFANPYFLLLKLSDGAEYVCEAVNVAGRERGSINFHILVPPRLETEEEEHIEVKKCYRCVLLQLLYYLLYGSEVNLPQVIFSTSKENLRKRLLLRLSCCRKRLLYDNKRSWTQ